MKLSKKIICILLIFGVFLSLGFSQTELNNSPVSESKDEESKMVLSEALNSYYEKDWKTSVFLFKKFHSDEKNITPESLYMLIMAQTYNNQEKNAISDCDLFIKKYPSNQYLPLVIYQKGKLLFLTKDFEKSIITLSDFCNSYPTHSLYSNALFLIAENFYFSYNFENAKPLYTRVIEEFPDSKKVKEAVYRLDVLAQRNREEKLMYLLQQTGEGYLLSKESFEKRVITQNVENSVDMNTQLNELRLKNQQLDYDLEQEKKLNAELEALVKSFEDEYILSIKSLKEQAEEVYNALELLPDGE